jgi:hypothetical protein
MQLMVVDNSCNRRHHIRNHTQPTRRGSYIQQFRIGMGGFLDAWCTPGVQQQLSLPL